MKPLLTIVLAAASLSAVQTKQTFMGVISDDMCAFNGHAAMRMGPTDAECTVACVAIHGAAYVLYDGKNLYILSNQKTPEKFAARKVTITGTLDAKSKSIQVDSIRLAK